VPSALPGMNPERSLFESAAANAAAVRDPGFRLERMRLVLEYLDWWHAETPDVERAQAELAKIADRDARLAYIDHVSARWSRAPDQVSWESLKWLVPLALPDGTTLDAVLGRLVG